MTVRLDAVCRLLFCSQRTGPDGLIECDRCHNRYPYGKIGINLAHIEGRGGKVLRWEPMNWLALCNGPGTTNCHYWFDHNKIASTRWLEATFPEKAAWLCEDVNGKPRSALTFHEKVPWMLEKDKEIKVELAKHG